MTDRMILDDFIDTNKVEYAIKTEFGYSVGSDDYLSNCKEEAQESADYYTKVTGNEATVVRVIHKDYIEDEDLREYLNGLETMLNDKVYYETKYICHFYFR